MVESDGPIEQYLRITEMKAELNELSDGKMTMGVCQDTDQGIEDAFLESVLAYERAEQVSLRTLLERDGVIVPDPSELSDEELTTELGDVIQALARRRTFLECTDHLGDRELYTHLVEVSLEETGPDLPPDDQSNCHIDITGGCSGEDTEIYLRYYADEDWRNHWAESFPDDVIPPHEDPPYDRDRHLPKPPSPQDRYDDPDVAAQWCAEQHRKLLLQLADEGVIHGEINPEPVSFAPPIAAVWAVGSRDCSGVVEWWALNGDCPLVYVSAKEIPNQRDFLRAVSERWNAEVDALEAARQAERTEEACNESRIPVQPFCVRRWYARVLETWAADDSAWGEGNG